MLMTNDDRSTYREIKARWNALKAWFAADVTRASDAVGELAAKWGAVDRGVASDPSHFPGALADVAAAEQHAAHAGYPGHPPADASAHAGYPGHPAAPTADTPAGFSLHDVATVVGDVATLAGPVVAVAPYLVVAGPGADVPSAPGPGAAEDLAAKAPASPLDAAASAVSSAAQAVGDAATAGCRAVWGAGPMGDWACEGKEITAAGVASGLPWWVWVGGAAGLGAVGLAVYAGYRAAKAAVPYAPELLAVAAPEVGLPLMAARAQARREIDPEAQRAAVARGPEAWGAYAGGVPGLNAIFKREQPYKIIAAQGTESLRADEEIKDTSTFITAMQRVARNLAHPNDFAVVVVEDPAGRRWNLFVYGRDMNKRDWLPPWAVSGLNATKGSKMPGGRRARLNHVGFAAGRTYRVTDVEGNTAARRAIEGEEFRTRDDFLAAVRRAAAALGDRGYAVVTVETATKPQRWQIMLSPKHVTEVESWWP